MKGFLTMAYCDEKLIIITEKEYFQDYIFKKNYDSRKKLILFIFVYLYNLNKKIKALLFRLSCKLLIKRGYIIGLHFGNNFNLTKSKLISNQTISFVMCPSSAETSHNFKLPMTSRDFSNRRFIEYGIVNKHKQFDFICIANNSKNKNLLKFLESLIFNKYNGTGIFVIPTHDHESIKTHDVEIVKIYNTTDEDFKSRISIVRLSNELGFQGLQGPALPLLTSLASYLVLPSDSEGEPRVVTEGILAGAKIILPAWQTSNLPIEYNEFILRFKDFSNLIDILMKPANFDEIKHKKFIDAYSVSAEKFITYIRTNFGIKIDSVERYDRILPGHVNMNFPWSDNNVKYNYPNIEIYKYIQVIKFLHYAVT